MIVADHITKEIKWISPVHWSVSSWCLFKEGLYWMSPYSWQPPSATLTSLPLLLLARCLCMKESDSFICETSYFFFCASSHHSLSPKLSLMKSLVHSFPPTTIIFTLSLFHYSLSLLLLSLLPTLPSSVNDHFCSSFWSCCLQRTMIP